MFSLTGGLLNAPCPKAKARAYNASMDKYEKEVLARVKKMVKEKGYTQARLAKALGKEQYTISRYLSGTPFPSLNFLRQLAETLDISLFYLLGLQERSYRELSSKSLSLLEAYEESSPEVKGVIDKILDLSQEIQK